MKETLEFVLGSFWRFLGALFLIGVILSGIADIVAAWRFPR